MINLTTQYAGLTLRNPIIIGSSGLTDSVVTVKSLEEHGAGAVVLKSIFEEEITNEYHALLQEMDADSAIPENLDYLDLQIKQDTLNKYLVLITECKAAVSIPVIASVNCVTSHEWTYFAKKIQDAGADALQLNIYIHPTDFSKTAADLEVIYFDIIEKVKSTISIPIILKISHYFTNLGNFIKRLSETGIAGIVLFNRFYSPDIDIVQKEIASTGILSKPEEINLPLRWIGIMSPVVKCDLAASTGVHDGKAVIKKILAGADAIELVSVIYLKGLDQIRIMLNEVTNWMEKNQYETIPAFRGKLSRKQVKNPAIYDRAQFMKYYGGYKQ